MGETPVAWLDDDEMRAWVGLIRLSARLVGLADGELRRAHGITGRDYELLHHLGGHRDGVRVSELAELIDDTSSCITHRVNRLVASGLVDKVADPSDARARLVRLTSGGRRLLERAAPDHVRRVRRWVIDPLDRRQLRQLAELAETLDDHLRRIEPVERT
jgi:DNA-binding MarR family transcriptional regulator